MQNNQLYKTLVRVTTLGLILAACAAPATPTAAPAPTTAPATVAPTEAATEVAAEPTVEATVETTAEATTEATAEAAIEATAEMTTTAEPTAEATVAAEPMTATVEATSTMEAGAGSALTAEQISFDDMGLANGKPMRNETRPATAAGDANAPGPGAGEPASIRFTFPDEKADAYVSPIQPQLLVYSVEDYQALLTSENVEEAQNPIAQLTQLLADKPATISGTLPILPQIPGSQVFHAQTKYLTFKSGAGVRYLTRYTFDVSPIANDNLFYTFQGLSSDGQHYIAFYYPIKASALPAESANAKAEQAEMDKDYDAYITKTVTALDKLAASGFTPELAKLDGLIESLALSQTDATTATTGSTEQPIISGTVLVTETQVISITPSLPTTSTAQEGECFAASIASTRADAYRCTIGNAIQDPCFVAEDGPGEGQTLVCGIDPIKNEAGFVLTVTKALPEANKADLPQHPWLIKLSDGVFCNFATGGSGIIAGERINFYCSDKSVIVGDLTPGTVWQAQRAVPTNADGNEFGAPSAVVVATVWE